MIGAAGNSAVPTADARTGQANHRGFVRFLHRARGVLQDRWERTVIVVCWKVMAKVVNWFILVVRKRIGATSPLCT